MRPSVFWPSYSSDEDWVCQILNVYVNDKKPSSDKESAYASCWLPSRKATRLYPLLPQDTGHSTPQKPWDVLDHLPPPYNKKEAPDKPEEDKTEEEKAKEREERKQRRRRNEANS